MANIVDENAKPAIDELLDGFKPVSYDLRCSDTTFIDYFPISGCGSGVTSLRWVIPKPKGNFVNLINKMVIAMELKLTNSQGTSTLPMQYLRCDTRKRINKYNINNHTLHQLFFADFKR